MWSLGSRLITLCAIAGCATLLVCQSPVQAGSGKPAVPKRVIEPYTAEFKTTSEKTLGNGTTIRHETTQLEARDAEGRTLSAQEIPSHDGGPNTTAYFVHDPVAGTDFNWNSNSRQIFARSISTTRQEPNAGCSALPVAPREIRPNAIKDVREDLGTRTFEGLEAKGTRITHTVPLGLAGNDAPLVRITESWMTHTPPLVVRQVMDDPESGKSIRELVRYVPGAPDPDSFLPPAGYEIQVQESHSAGCEP
jgi:hypothetical protein